MPFDVSVHLVGLIVLGVLSLLCIAAIFCSGRKEELDAGVDAVLTVADLEADWAQFPPMREEALHAKPYNVEEDW